MADNTRHLTFDEVVAIIHARSIPEPNSGCMLWEGCVKQKPLHRLPKNGVTQSYGTVRLHGKMVPVHRVMFEATNGPITSDIHVLHRCDIGICCNPAHLFVGTNGENIMDKMRKDRGKKRLTHEKALDIHRLFAAGASQSELAEQFDVVQGTISRVLSGKRRPLAMLSQI